MAKEIIKRLEEEEWYKHWLEEAQAIIVETLYISRSELIKGKWLLGEHIEEGIKKAKKRDIRRRIFVDRIAKDLDQTERNIYLCSEFYRKFKASTVEMAFQQLPEGKNISWWKITQKYLPSPRIQETEERWQKCFDVWNFSSIDEHYGEECPGRIPYQIIANTLHYFTNPKDLIVDPMAGGGTLVDVCKEMNRRYLACDIYPRRKEIQKKDLIEGFDEKAKNCDLIFLDPPYWKKLEEQYIEGSISRLEKEDYINFFKKLIPECKKILKPKGYIAFLMSNYIDYDEPKNSIFTADYYKIFIDNDFLPIIEIQCPLSSEQYRGYDVERAKKEKKMLIISRSLYIWENTKEVNS